MKFAGGLKENFTFGAKASFQLKQDKNLQMGEMRALTEEGNGL